jgi:hypothetical protein
MRRRSRSTLLTAIVMLVAGVIMTTPATGQDDDHPEEGTPTTATTLPGAVGIGDNLSFLGGEVLDAAGQTVRTYDAKQAAVFVQSWLASLFGDPEIQVPPADATRYTVRINGTWVSATGYQTIHYAEQGEQAWVSWPQGQIATTSPTTVPAPEEWFVPPPKALEAFQGRGDLANTLGVFQATSVPGQQATGDTPSESESDNDAILWIAIAAAAVVVLVGGGLLLRRRRAQPELPARR